MEASLHEIDYRELPQRFGKRFDAVVCLATSIAEAPNDEEALRALRSMRDVLREGGILVLDQGTTDKQWKEKARFILASDTRKVSRLFVIDYFEDSARYNILDVFHREKGGELTLWSRDLHILLRDDQEKLLIAAGFRRVEFFGSYRFGPYDKETSNRLIAVAYS